MAIGARDHLDQLLVKKYASLKVDNPVIESSMIDPNKMYDAMNDYANMQRSMLNMHAKLRETCIKTTALAIQYRKTKSLSKNGAPA